MNKNLGHLVCLESNKKIINAVKHDLTTFVILVCDALDILIRREKFLFYIFHRRGNYFQLYVQYLFHGSNLKIKCRILFQNLILKKH